MRALILVDIQNDFLPDGALAVPHGHEVIAVANSLLDAYDLVVATQDWHPSDHLSFASQHDGHNVGDMIDLAGTTQVLWPDHCVQGSHGAQLAAALEQDKIDHVVPKGTDRRIDSYSGFYDNDHRHETGLAEYLRGSGISEVDIVGLATDYCVKATALDARQLGFRTRVILEGVRGVNLNSGDVDSALEVMRANGVEIVTELPQSTDNNSLETLWEGRHLSFVSKGHWEYVTRTKVSGVVGIVALTQDRRIILVEQYRLPVQASVIEIPAGLAGDLDGSEDEPLVEAAKRELLEETGYRAEKWTLLTAGCTSPGLTDESITMFLAEKLEKVESGGGDASESIEVLEVPLGDLASWLAAKQQSGVLIDLKLYAALYFAQQAATGTHDGEDARQL
jgi:nicotinamidase/pyrazinamidase